MKIITKIKLIPCIILVIAAFSCTSGSDHYKQYMKLLEKIENSYFPLLKEDVNAHFQAYNNLAYVTEKISHRMTGTEYGKKAEEFAFKVFQQNGLDVRYFPFKMKMWQRNKANLCIFAGDKADDIDTASFAYTPLVSDVRSRIVDAGDGLYEDIQALKGELSGNIALINLSIMDPVRIRNKVGDPPRSYKTKLAETYGARGVIFINKNQGELLQTGTVTLDSSMRSQIPALCVSFESGRKIRNYLVSGELVEAHIETRSYYQDVEARNVIARIEGLENPDERIIIGAHLDSWDMGSGAIDNGIGAATVMEVARVLKKTMVMPKRTIEFVLWMGEEHGLMGSKAFIQNELRKGTIDSIKYYINIDMHGNPRGMDIEGHDVMEEHIKKLGKKIADLGIDYKNETSSKPTMAPYSDDLCFSIQGIPTIQEMPDLDPYVYHYYHTHRDSFSLVRKEHLQFSALIMSFVTYRLATVPEIQAQRLNVDQTYDFFKQHGGEGNLVPVFNWQLRESIEGKVHKKDKQDEQKNGTGQNREVKK